MNNDALLLGAHISTAGGVPASPGRAKAVGATAMQIFTKMANQWRERECEPEECAAFREGIAETEVRAISAHDSYLINLASPKDDLRARSLQSFIAELRAGLPPGSVVAVTASPDGVPGDDTWLLPGLADADDAAFALPAVITAQLIALRSSTALGIRPDNPFPSGEVNRVVQGVTVHPLPEPRDDIA